MDGATTSTSVNDTNGIHSINFEVKSAIADFMMNLGHSEKLPIIFSGFPKIPNFRKLLKKMMIFC